MSRQIELPAEPPRIFVVFAGDRRVGEGALAEAAVVAQRAEREHRGTPVLVFDRTSGHVRDLDLRGDETEVFARHAAGRATKGPGRPKLGVVAREVTLLPRHWDWLANQPGGASAALRRLVDAARRVDAGDERRRAEITYRFMSTMAGNRPGFEEAARALFASDDDRFTALTAGWPEDIRDELARFLAS